MKKQVVVLGASANYNRYSNKLVIQLIEKGYIPIPIGRKEGEIGGLKIQTELPIDKVFYAISIYLNASNQEEYHDFIINCKTEKIIFNPGSENPKLFQELQENEKFVEEACSLVQLSLGIF